MMAAAKNMIWFLCHYISIHHLHISINKGHARWLLKLMVTEGIWNSIFPLLSCYYSLLHASQVEHDVCFTEHLVRQITKEPTCDSTLVQVEVGRAAEVPTSLCRSWFDTMITFGGSPTAVAAPPMLVKITSAIRTCLGSRLSTSHNLQN